MCLFNSPKPPPPPVIPPEPAQMRQPDAGAVRDSVSRRTQDRMRSRAQTVLTSGAGVIEQGQTGRKTLLGQ